MSDGIILLVEDNPDDAFLTRRALQKGHIANDVLTAHDGEVALDMLFGRGLWEGARIEPVLVLLDLKLPKIDGLEVLRQLRQRPETLRLPVVVLTSSREDEDLARSYDLGANSYVVKPVDHSQFGTAVAQLGLYWLVLNQLPPHAK